MSHCATCLSSSKGSRTYIVIIYVWCKNSCGHCPSYAVLEHLHVKGMIKGMGDTNGRTAPCTAVLMLIRSCFEMMNTGRHYFNVLSRVFDYNIHVKLYMYIFLYRLSFLVENYYYEQTGFSVLLVYEIMEILLLSFLFFTSLFSAFSCCWFSQFLAVVNT